MHEVEGLRESPLSQCLHDAFPLIYQDCFSQNKSGHYGTRSVHAGRREGSAAATNERAKCLIAKMFLLRISWPLKNPRKNVSIMRVSNLSAALAGFQATEWERESGAPCTQCFFSANPVLCFLFLPFRCSVHGQTQPMIKLLFPSVISPCCERRK